MACRDPEKRPSAVQCLQHSYFQVGIRTPLAVRSPRSNASSLASKPPHHQAQPHQQQGLSQQRRASHEAPLERKGGALPGVAAGTTAGGAGARGLGAGGRDAFGARDPGQLPSLHSFGSLGPRNARYKVGVQPAAVMVALSDAGSAGQQGSAQAKQPPAGVLPALSKAPLPRGGAGAKGPGGLEARYGLGRRY